jgi:hypothetical protein
LAVEVAASAKDGTLQSQVNALKDALPSLSDRIDAAEKTASAAPGLERIREVAHTVAVGVFTEKGPEIAAAVQPIAHGGLTAALTALGVSAPVAGIGAWLAARIAKRGIKRISDRIQANGQSVSSPSPAGGKSNAIQPVLIPGQSKTDTVYVGVPTADPSEEAKRRAERNIAMSDPHAAAFFLYRDKLAQSQLSQTQ